VSADYPDPTFTDYSYPDGGLDLVQLGHFLVLGATWLLVLISAVLGTLVVWSGKDPASYERYFAAPLRRARWRSWGYRSWSRLAKRCGLSFSEQVTHKDKDGKPTTTTVWTHPKLSRVKASEHCLSHGAYPYRPDRRRTRKGRAGNPRRGRRSLGAGSSGRTRHSAHGVRDARTPRRCPPCPDTYPGGRDQCAVGAMRERLRSCEEVAMVLGDGLADAAPAHRISPTTYPVPGTWWPTTAQQSECEPTTGPTTASEQ
jgi:hypothetical protein